MTVKGETKIELAGKRVRTTIWSRDVPVLTVKNFSCIKNLTVEFRRIVVFIGEQASGKSVTCKLYYFFTQALRKVAMSCLREERGVEDFHKRLMSEFRAIFPETAWIQDTFSIDWKIGARRISASHKRGDKTVKLNIYNYRDSFVRALEKCRAASRGDSDGHEDFEGRWRYDRLVENVVADEFSDVSVDYVPAGRAFFSTIQHVIFSLLTSNVDIDYFLKEFGQKLEVFRRLGYSRTEDVGKRAFFEELCRQILHGKYHYDGKDQWIITDKNHKIRLADSSSGQQEALPLLMVLAMQATLSRRSGGVNRVLVEEPEAHLYPTAQQNIVDAIGRILQTVGSVGCIITTHSPFILCCLNNVLKRQSGLRSSVSACHLHDGIGDNIYDAELGLINAERFDDISIEIANA